MQVATPVSVTPRDARSADFVGNFLPAAGPLAEGLKAFSTPVPLPANAIPAFVPAAQGPATASQLPQGHDAQKHARPEQATPQAHAAPGCREGFHGRSTLQQLPVSAEGGSSAAALSTACSMDMSPQAGSLQTPKASRSVQPPPQARYAYVPSSQRGTPRGTADAAELASPRGVPKEKIAEVLTGHLHAWGKTLQKLRRPGRSPPGDDMAEPDMQPLGRPFLAQPAEADLARYARHIPPIVHIMLSAADYLLARCPMVYKAHAGYEPLQYCACNAYPACFLTSLTVLHRGMHPRPPGPHQEDSHFQQRSTYRSAMLALCLTSLCPA